MKLSMTSLHFLDKELAMRLSQFLVETVMAATNTKNLSPGVPLVKIKQAILEVTEFDIHRITNYFIGS